MSSDKTWVVALGLGGEVLGADPAAPAGWAGRALHEDEGIPAELREAARAVVLSARQSGALARTRVEVPALGASIEICVLPAVRLQREGRDPRALLMQAVAALERQARALDVALEVAVDEDVPAEIRVDPEKIAWLVTALVGNAMRFVRRGTRQMPGGSIVVRASRDEARGDVLIAVEDDGPGIPAAVLDRLFRRAPGAPLATGLALTVARDIVEAHGGSLTVDSSTEEIDQGTTVTLRLPPGGP